MEGVYIPIGKVFLYTNVLSISLLRHVHSKQLSAMLWSCEFLNRPAFYISTYNLCISEEHVAVALLTITCPFILALRFPGAVAASISSGQTPKCTSTYQCS